MKKKIIKIATVTLVLLFTFATGVSANEAYHRWAGSEEYEQTKENIGLFQTAYTNLFNTKEQLIKDKDALTNQLTATEAKLATANGKIDDTNRLYGEVKNQLTNLIADVNESNGKGNRYDALAVKVNELAGYVGIKGRIDSNVGNGSKSEDLKQAEEDMEDLKEQTDALLEEINGEE